MDAFRVDADTNFAVFGVGEGFPVDADEGGVAGEHIDGVFGDADEESPLGGLFGLPRKGADDDTVFLPFHCFHSGGGDGDLYPFGAVGDEGCLDGPDGLILGPFEVAGGLLHGEEGSSQEHDGAEEAGDGGDETPRFEAYPSVGEVGGIFGVFVGGRGGGVTGGPFAGCDRLRHVDYCTKPPCKT